MREVGLRVTSVVLLLGGLTWLTCPRMLVLGLVPAVLIWLPWLSWLSAVCEHSWFDARHATARTSWEREIACGKRTHFRGLLGWITRLLIFPIGDAYHLAHSLFPTLHFRHLPWFDRTLAAYSAPYRSVPQTYGLFGGPSGSGSLSFIYKQVCA